MILIALLIALSIERVTHLPAFWQMDFLLGRWLDWSQQKLAASRYQQQLQKPWVQMLWLLLPALAAGLLVSWLDNLLVTFIGGIIALLVACSCQPARNAYKQYLKTANKGEPTDQQQQQLQAFAGHDDTRAVEDTVCWLNYQYYVAIIFFFCGVWGFWCLSVRFYP